MKTSKMIYIRDDNNAVVAIRTEIDWSTGDMDWSVSMCNKDDRFVKKTSIDLCKNTPFLSGSTTFSTTYVKKAKQKAPNFHTYEYLNTVAINALMIASEREKRIPTWASDIIMDEYFTTTSGDIFGWGF